MRNFVTIPSNLYVHTSAIPILQEGDETKGYISVPDANEYTLINKHAFQQGIQLNENTFLVSFIMK